MDAPTLSALLAERVEALALEILGEPSQRTRREWRWGRHGSLALLVQGQDAGQWYDHEISNGGHLLQLIAREHRCDFAQAVRWATAWLGGTANEVRPTRSSAISRLESREAQHARNRELARRIWRESVPAIGTPAETYLGRRGLARLDWPDDPDVIRFHPACPRGAERHPAMIALMTDPETNEPLGIHRTFLLPDGSDRLRDKKAKAMLGNAGVIRLSPDDEVTMGLSIAEGIESALSVMQRTGWRPVWAASSAGAIRTFPILPGIEALTIFADADGAGITAARECALRWCEAGREACVIAPPAGDWNDAARAA